jgi:hypothetical protein
MSEAEALELTLIASANAVTSFTVYITVTFGYLAASYFTGRKLTNSQALIVSSLYLFSAFGALLNLLSDNVFYAAALEHAPTLTPENALIEVELWNTYMTILLSAGILASLYFMWSIRHPATSELESEHDV